MNVLEQFQKIKTFVFDIDGVFTDNRILVTESGEFLRLMNIRDGYIVKKATQLGYRICCITGGTSKGVENRLRNLGIVDFYPGISDKKPVLSKFMEDNDLQPSEVLYMGDDVADIKPMLLVGCRTCPADAIPSVKKIATYISPMKGGDGCVRDVVEKVMKIQGKWTR